MPLCLQHSPHPSFDPRPRAGGDRLVDHRLQQRVGVSIHASARGATGVPAAKRIKGMKFRSTPPRGGRRGNDLAGLVHDGFDPRPRAGGDRGLSTLLFYNDKETVLHGAEDGRGAPALIGCYARRMYSGRPSSSIWFKALTARAISVSRWRPVREHSPSPITRLNRLMSASTRARQS